MKNVVIAEVSRANIHKVRVKPEDKVKNVLNRLKLGRGLLVKSSYTKNGPLKGNDLLYKKVEDNEKLYFHATANRLFPIKETKRGGDQK